MFQTIFFQPIFNLLIFLYNLIPDLGVATILLTVIVKLILLPLSKQSLKSQKELQEIQPKIDALKEQYKDDREGLTRATLAIYKEHKVNPLSSCLPLLIQLPFMIAVFQVFRSDLESTLGLLYPFVARPETINHIAFGFLDLSVRSIPLAVLAGAAQFWQSKMLVSKKPPVTENGAKDETMMTAMNKQMLYVMPLVTVLFGIQFSGGLALYWFITTLLTGLQQLYIFKKK